MNASKRTTLAVAVCALAAAPAGAQVFRPPESGARTTRSEGIRLGVVAFSTRVGGQLNRDGQGLVGSTVDIAELGSSQVRLRPSFELGFGRPERSLHVATEVIYRFQPEDSPAIPYVGAGIGYYDDGRIDRLWPNLVMGFEMRFRPAMNWLLEYHALDRLGRHRFLVGLSTRSER